MQFKWDLISSFYDGKCGPHLDTNDSALKRDDNEVLKHFDFLGSSHKSWIESGAVA